MQPRVAALVFIAIAVVGNAGCDSKADSGGGGQTGAGGSPGGGSGGADPASDASADLTSSGVGDAMTVTDAPTERTDVVLRNFCGNHPYESGLPIPDVTADVFCARYDTACRFGSPGGYATMADCAARYGGESATIQGCLAGRVCDAAFFGIQIGVPAAALQDYCKRALAGCR